MVNDSLPAGCPDYLNGRSTRFWLAGQPGKPHPLELRLFRPNWRARARTAFSPATRAACSSRDKASQCFRYPSWHPITLLSLFTVLLVAGCVPVDDSRAWLDSKGMANNSKSKKRTPARPAVDMLFENAPESARDALAMHKQLGRDKQRSEFQRRAAGGLNPEVST